MLPLSCSCSLAREDVSYPNFGGAKVPLVAQRRPNAASKVLVAGHFNSSLLYCGAYVFSTTPCVHRPPTYPCLLAPNTLTWAALSLPLSCSGFSTRNDVSRPCYGGAMAPRCFTIKLFFAAMASHTPGQLEPTTLPQRRLAPVSCSVCVSLPLSPSLSLLPSLSLSLSPSPSLCAPLSLSLSLSLSHKRGFRDVRRISIPLGVRTPLYRTEEVRYTH